MKITCYMLAWFYMLGIDLFLTNRPRWTALAACSLTTYMGESGASLTSVRECLLNKPYWRSNVEKNLFCTLYRALKLVAFHSYMNCKCKIFMQNAELLAPVAQNWHNFFRRIIEMAENRRKQQKSMSLSLTSETAVEYTIWPTNDTYIITVCWVMKNREKQMISTSWNSCWVEHVWWW